MLRTILLCVLLVLAQGVVHQNCSFLNDIVTGSSQYLVVQSTGGSKASIISCERGSQNVWAPPIHEYDCIVGTNGIAQPGQKREGDGMTPSGDYSVGEFFGWYTTADSSVRQFKSDYRYIVDAKDLNGFYLDKFIDDAYSTYYNRWVSGPTEAASFEQMRISAYKYGLVVNYNMNPIVSGINHTSCLICCDQLSLSLFYHYHINVFQVWVARFSCISGQGLKAPPQAASHWMRPICCRFSSG